MYIAYVDEAGNLAELTSPTVDIEPVFVQCGLLVHAANLPELTRDFLHLKHRFYPGHQRTPHYLDSMLFEVKGSDIRRNLASSRKRDRKWATGQIDKILAILKKHNVRIVAKVLVKSVGRFNDHTALYTAYTQSICMWFQQFLADKGDRGIIIADHREYKQDRQVSHSIFSQKFKSGGDPYDRVMEMPTFGVSDNHVGLQLADIVGSGLIAPLCIETYCREQISNVHVRSGYTYIRDRYASQIQCLLYRYTDSGWPKLCFYLDNELNDKRVAELFPKRPPVSAATPGGSAQPA